VDRHLPVDITVEVQVGADRVEVGTGRLMAVADTIAVDTRMRRLIVGAAVAGRAGADLVEADTGRLMAAADTMAVEGRTPGVITDGVVGARPGVGMVEAIAGRHLPVDIMVEAVRLPPEATIVGEAHPGAGPDRVEVSAGRRIIGAAVADGAAPHGAGPRAMPAVPLRGDGKVHRAGRASALPAIHGEDLMPAAPEVLAAMTKT
jgi:hypothetical protein